MPFLLAALLLAGCRTAPEAVGTFSPTSDETRTRSFTRTMHPPRTITPTITERPTWTLDPTEALQATQVAVFPGSCGIPYLETLVSPGGNWLATNCSEERSFRVISRDGSRHWEIPLGCIPDENEPFWGSGISQVLPYHWSTDSRYLYFKTFPCYEPSVVQIFWYGMEITPRSLFIMDTQTGQWYQFLPPANVFSFSSTGRRLFYLQSAELDVPTPWIDVIILDLRTGKTALYRLSNYLAAEYVIWSRDGTRVIFGAERGLPVYLPGEENHTFTIFMIDLNTRALIPIRTFVNSEKVIYPAAWLEDSNVIVLHTGNNVSDTHFTVLYLDLSTLEVSTEAPNP